MRLIKWYGERWSYSRGIECSGLEGVLEGGGEYGRQISICLVVVVTNVLMLVKVNVK